MTACSSLTFLRKQIPAYQISAEERIKKGLRQEYFSFADCLKVQSFEHEITKCGLGCCSLRGPS